MNYFKTMRPAEKVIDCEYINKICKVIEMDIPNKSGGLLSLTEKAHLIYTKLCDNVHCPDALPLLDGLEEEIIDNDYQSAAVLANAVWLRLRHLGIGGSDAASIMGLSKWRTILDLYYDKRNEKPKEQIDEGKQYIFDFGHAMEAFVAEAFEKKFEKHYRDNFELQFTMKYKKPISIVKCKVFRDTFMYRNPDHKFMIADLDFVVEFTLSTGEILRGIFECKTTSPFTLADAWKDAPPKYYVAQINHYMEVMDYDFSVIACAADNSSANYFAHLIFKENNFVADMIKKEQKFITCVKKGNPPYEEGINNLQIISTQMDKTNDDVLELNNPSIIDKLLEIEQIKAQISGYNSIIDTLEEKKDIATSDILVYMDKQNHHKGSIVLDGKSYTVEVTQKSSKAIDYPKFFRELKQAYPTISKDIETIKENCRKDTSVKSSCSVKIKNLSERDLKKLNMKIA